MRVATILTTLALLVTVTVTAFALGSIEAVPAPLQVQTGDQKWRIYASIVNADGALMAHVGYKRAADNPTFDSEDDCKKFMDTDTEFAASLPYIVMLAAKVGQQHPGASLKIACEVAGQGA